MKRLTLGIVLAIVATVVLGAMPADREFQLVNRTGLTIDEVYLSPANANAWGDDVLGVDVVPHNGRVAITWSRSESTCSWDLKTVDDDDAEVVWTGLDLCRASEVTLHFRNGTPTAEIR